MIKHISTLTFKACLFILVLLFAFSTDSNAQNLKHAASRGGGKTISRPTAPRTMPNRTSAPKSINGGHTKTNDRSFPKAKATTNKATAIPSVSKNKGTTTLPNSSTTRNVKTSTIKNKNGNRVGNNTININIDNSRHNNIRNTRVVNSSVRYTRPPYHYGGYGYYCHTPYYYHPYTPYYWGSYYHPWGYFVASIATTAIIVAIVNDNNKEEYHYDNGTYYLKTEDGFEAVQAPVGAQVPSIPKEAETVEINNTTNNYYYGGAFYEKNSDGYIVVPATAGTIVPSLPEGGDEIKIGDVTYVQFGETYYQPIQVNGKNMYEIVEVKKE